MDWSASSSLLDDSWKELGACWGSQSEEFFPEPHKGRGGASEAKRICAGCHVQMECLEFAIVTNQKHGIWGGETYSGRMKLRRKLRIRASA